MPPRSSHDDPSFSSMPLHHDSILDKAAMELESMKGDRCLHRMPPACFSLIKSMKGNSSCVDCGSSDPDWAAISYGALVCLRCSGRHRSLGVQTSRVKSLTMDDWSHDQILSMLEGGNKQLYRFFKRHALTHCAKSPRVDVRYKTKAARFYREQMKKHVCQVVDAGTYQGREASRMLHRQSSGPPLSSS